MVIDVSIENLNHLKEVLRVPAVSGIILPGDRMTEKEWKSICDQVKKAGKQAFYAFPFVLRGDMAAYYREQEPALREAGFDGFLVRSLDEAGYLMETEIPGIRLFDQGMYTWNRRAIDQMKQLGADLTTVPYEARREELEQRGFRDSEMVIYGRLPVMISAQCTRKTTGKCRLTQGKTRAQAAAMAEFLPLNDRKKAAFREDSHCRFCYSVIYNSVPLWLVDQVPFGCDRVRFAFTDEKVGEAEAILRSCTDGNAEDNNVRLRQTRPSGEFTRGHLKRGVE